MDLATRVLNGGSRLVGFLGGGGGVDVFVSMLEC